MAMYQHILLATDLSEKESSQILTKALEIARLHNAKLTLLYVVEYTGSMYTGEIPLPEDLDLDQHLAEEAHRKMNKIIQAQGLKNVESRVEIGIPKREIVRVAEELGVDLIVLGSHGRHGLQLILGSTANGVLHLATCDVLAIRVKG